MRVCAASVILGLLSFDLCTSHWPICYDYAVQDGCFQRDPSTGAEMPEDGLSTSRCYFSDPWTEEARPPWAPQGAAGIQQGQKNSGGHEDDLQLTLPLCSNDVRQSWHEMTAEVNKECDYKTWLEVKRCGNCWTAICKFHNNMHWNNLHRFCTQQMFSYRMQCYSKWYDRYCGRPSPDESGEQLLFLIPNKAGVYERCSSSATRGSAVVTITLSLSLLMSLCVYRLLP